MVGCAMVDFMEDLSIAISIGILMRDFEHQDLINGVMQINSGEEETTQT